MRYGVGGEFLGSQTLTLEGVEVETYIWRFNDGTREALLLESGAIKGKTSLLWIDEAFLAQLLSINEEIIS